MADANTDPFCSSATRSVWGVDELKNLTQLVLICAIAAALPATLAVAVSENVGEEELELLEEQADSAATSMRPNTGIVRAREAAEGNRMSPLSIRQHGACCGSPTRASVQAQAPIPAVIHVKPS